MSWLIEIRDHETDEVESQIRYETREACEGAFNGFVTLFNLDSRKRVVTMHEIPQLTLELDPALEAQEAQRKHEAEEQRIEKLCEELEGHGMCSNLTPVGDEYDRNWGQCHICDEWGIVHCDFGIQGSRALCEKHLNMAAQDRLQTFLNVYRVARLYGGPEEGGWYYNVGEPVLSLPITQPVSDERIEEMRQRLRELGPQLVGRVYDSVIEDDYSVHIELRPGRYWPLEKPHYE